MQHKHVHSVNMAGEELPGLDRTNTKNLISNKFNYWFDK